MASHRIAIVGAGAFGFALAVHLDRSGDGQLDLRLYDSDRELASRLASGHTHPRLEARVGLPSSAAFHTELAETVAGVDVVILAVPGRAVPAAARQLAAVMPEDLPLLNVAKALERESGRRIGEVVAEARGERSPYAAMAGGMIADELVRGGRLGTVVAAVERGLAEKLAELLEGPGLLVEASTDVIGVEYASAFKNVLVIGMGLLEGLGHPLGSRTLFLSLVTAEIEELVVVLGGSAATLAMTSQCWGNDLILSAFGTTRNRAFGTALAEALQGERDGDRRRARVEEVRTAIEERGGTVEGCTTAEVIPRVVERAGIAAPRLSALASLLDGEIDSAEAAERLLR